MWRVVVLFLCLAAVGYAASWLADRPGAISLEWLGFRIETSVGVLAAALAPLWAFLLGYGSMVVLAAALAVIVFLRHHQNIARILQGTEPKIGKKS